MSKKSITHSLPVWTELEFNASCFNPYLAQPVFQPDDTNYFICREDGSREQSRLAFVVFKHTSDDDWEDDPKPGINQVQVLGDGDEEVESQEVVYLGMDACDFINVVAEDDRDMTFEIYWRHGDVALEKSRKTDDGYFVCHKDDFDEEGLRLTLTPKDGTDPFSLNVVIPLTGFSLRNDDDELVGENVDIVFSDADKYTYEFIGDGDNDRFTIALENNKLTYLCVLRDDGTLAVRDQRNSLAIVNTLPSRGKLSELMMDAHQALVKNKNKRWRINLSGSTFDHESEQLECAALPLVRFAFKEFAKCQGEEAQAALADQLMHLEKRMLFQWFWLNEDDWSHDHLADMLDIDNADDDKILQQALLYNQFDAFMRQLSALSYLEQAPIQADQLQARNNKRKIARCVKRIHAHRSGENDLWNLPAEDREENLHFFWEFHREFTEKLEEEA